MKQTIVNDLSNEELKDKIAEEKVALTKLKFSHAISPIENPMKIQAARKVIARLITESRKRQLSNK
ncbi:MAG: 50S ribosomal protein L29 [Bacteroidetes bacterium]|nr:50S ribosomal protein L29 [Bacteroidota bacterium]